MNALHPQTRCTLARRVLALPALALLLAGGASQAQSGPMLELSGRAFFTEPLANASVVVRIGDIESQGLTDANGHYRIAVNLPDADLPVELRVYGQGEQSPIAYASWADTSAQLASRADPAGRVDATDLAFLNLTPFTTAMHAVMNASPSIDGVTDRTSFDIAAQSWRYKDLQNLAVLVGIVAAGLGGPPEGIANTIEMIATLSNAQAAWDSLIGPEEYYSWSCPSNACTAWEALVGTSGVLGAAKLPSGQEIASFLALAAGSGFNWSANLAPRGTARAVLDFDQESDYDWMQLGDELRLAPTEGEGFKPSISFPFVQLSGSPGMVQVLEVQTQLNSKARAIRGPANRILMGVSSDLLRERAGWPSRLIVGIPKFPNATTVIDRRSVIPGWQVAGRDWALPRLQTLCGFADNSCPTDLHRFNVDGSGLVLRDGASFGWNLNERGNLVLSYSGGPRVELVKHSQAAAYTTILGFAESPEGDQRWIYFNQGAERSEVGFEASQVAGRYEIAWIQGGMISPYNLIYPGERQFPFGFEFAADGSGARIDTGAPLSWTLDAQGRLLFEIERSTGDSTINQRRAWTLVTKRGGLVAMVEHFVSGLPAPALDPNGPTDRLAVYRRVDAPIPTKIGVVDSGTVLSGRAAAARIHRQAEFPERDP